MNKVLPTPSYTVLIINLYRSAAKMTSFLKLLHYTTHTRTLRYALRSREIYTKEPITSPEILSELPQTQDDSINSIQDTPDSQFRLVLSVTPCMPRISSIESVNHSSSPLLFSPTPTSSPVHAPTPDSPQNQPPLPPLSPTNSPTSFDNTSPQHEEPLLGSPELFSPTPISSTIQNKWPSPPPLSLNDPHALRKDTGYIIMKVFPQLMGATMCVAVLALPHLTPKLLDWADCRTIVWHSHHSSPSCTF